MYTKQPKKLLILYIMEIFQKYTDENHRLSQKEIGDILEKEYDMQVERKAIKRNIMELIEVDWNIGYTEVPRKGGSVLTDFYLKQKFTYEELRMLIDSLLFSRHIPYHFVKELIGKLESLSNVYFHSHVQHIHPLPEDRSKNKDIFLNIGLLDEAIHFNKKVSFEYMEYGSDKELHSKRTVDGSVRIYIVTPYQMAAKDGKYYLICNYDKYNDISNYRVDRIRNIQILKESGKPFESLEGTNGQRLNLTEYMNEHIYMYSSSNSYVKIRIVKPMISDVIDIFGKNVQFYDESETHISVRVRVNERSILQFAKNFAPDVVILSPERLRNQMRLELESALQAYKE